MSYLEPCGSVVTGHRQARTGTVVSINTSNGGVPKNPVAEAFISATGLLGDGQQDLRYHGGTDRAVVIYSAELIDALQREGHPVKTGSTGENLTVSGLDWDRMIPGVVLLAGGARLLLTNYCTPCTKISASFLSGESSRISQKVRPGWSRVCARVLAPGTVRTCDIIHLIEHPKPPTE